MSSLTHSLFLAKLPVDTLLFIGAIAAVVVVSWSYNYWRAAVKVAFVLVLVEGAIRKWALPQGQELVYFGKDMLLIGAYLRFYFVPDPDIRALTLRVPTGGIFALCGITALSALNFNIGSPILALIGLKGYFMYIPMAFMMPYLFRNKEELIRQITWYALIATPICLLGFLQFKSDRFSVINTFASGTLETGSTGFGFGDRARITGTFSYLTGHSTFVTFFTALHIALLTCKQSKFLRLWLMFNLPLLLANGFMGGSRSAVYSTVIVAVGFALASTTVKMGSTLKILATLGVGAAAVAFGATYYFKEATTMWTARATNADDNVQTRVIDAAKYAAELAFDTVGLNGFGMGTTMPVTAQLRNTLRIAKPERPPPLMDHELMQVVVELGLLCAMAWTAVRLITMHQSFVMFKDCRDEDLRPFVLAGFLVQIPYLYLSVVLNHTANFLLWGFIGLTFIPGLRATVQRRSGVSPSQDLPGSRLPLPRGSKFPQNHPHRIGRD